jgi:adenylate kinase family enzyme
LDSELEALGRSQLRAVLIDVPDEVLIERLSGRRIWHEQTEPLIAFYGRRQRLLRIDGEGLPSEIRRRLAAAITAPTDPAHASTIVFK